VIGKSAVCKKESDYQITDFELIKIMLYFKRIMPY